MPRLIVVTDGPLKEVTHDEEVRPAHMESEHSSLQVLERLAWAIQDAHDKTSRRQPPRRRRRPETIGRTYSDGPFE